MPSNVRSKSEPSYNNNFLENSSGLGNLMDNQINYDELLLEELKSQLGFVDVDSKLLYEELIGISSIVNKEPSRKKRKVPNIVGMRLNNGSQLMEETKSPSSNDSSTYPDDDIFSKLGFKI